MEVMLSLDPMLLWSCPSFSPGQVPYKGRPMAHVKVPDLAGPASAWELLRSNAGLFQQ